MLIEKARVFATAAHAAVGQVRKYTGEPYVEHPMYVASIVASVPHTDAMVCAALLHDVLEDTQVPEAVLRREFGDEVTDLVVWLTKIEVRGNRKIRKLAELERLATAPAEAQTIKLADMIANTSSIVEHDPVFATVYLEEKRQLVERLTKGDPTLRELAQRTIVGVA